MTDTIKPPLPEPAAEAAMDLCADHEGPVEACQYLPDGTRLYTADQMHAYAQACADAAVAQERERAARLAVEVSMGYASKWENDMAPVKQPYANNRILHAGWAVADAIRAGEPS